MILSDDQDDPSLDDEELQAVASLTQDDLLAIDQALLASTCGEWRKVALVVAAAMDAHPDRYYDIPDIYYGQRIRQLVSCGQLEAQGNLRRMRFSEVRLLAVGQNEA